MLTATERNEDAMARSVVREFQHIHMTKGKALVSVVAIMHLVGAYTLVMAPNNQLFTQGTRPIFALFSPMVWAVPFLIGGLGAASLVWRVSAARQVITWGAVIPTQMMWTAASGIAVYQGGGSAMFVVFLGATFAFTVIAAVVMAHDFTTGKR